MGNNQTRAFPNLVSVEAWSLSGKDGAADALHVDVSFMQARLGQEPESKIRFRLGVKRADVTFQLPADGSIAILQSSVAREPLAIGSTEQTISKSRSFEAKGSVLAKVAGRPSASGTLSSSTGLSTANSEIAKIGKPINEIEWRHKTDENSSHVWEVYSYSNDAMVGKPWCPVSQHRLKFRHSSTGSSISDPAKVRIFCYREDLKIDQIELKAGSITDRVRRRNREAAAEAVIRQILTAENLHHEDVSEKYARLQLAETLVLDAVE